MEDYDRVAALVDIEHAKFLSQLSELRKTFEGRWILFRDGAVVSDHASFHEAHMDGYTRFGRWGGYLVAEVTEQRPSDMLGTW